MVDKRHMVGARIRNLRESNGLSQRKFCMMIDMNRTHFSEVEKGKRNISLDNLIKIADGLNIGLEDLFRDM